MSQHDHSHDPRVRHTCCPAAHQSETDGGVSRRLFLGGMGGAALGGLALSGISWSMLSAAAPDLPAAPPRRALVVKPVLVYSTYKRAPQTSWRPWGGIQTQQDADQEVARIKGELDKLQATADFPVRFLPVAPVHNVDQVKTAPDFASADVLVVYAAGGSMGAMAKLGKDVIVFVRHRSGPVYLWYEIISPRYLRQHTDVHAIPQIDPQDVVVDSQEEILWRLRALGGLRSTLGQKILAIGGPSGWAAPNAPKLAREKWKFDIQTIEYKELGELIVAARKDQAAVALARKRANDYLKLPGTILETKKEFVENAFLLESLFRKLMAKANCRALTINGCMGTIMPLAETSACLPLSTLNDDGWMIFCESDFVVIPAGMLLVTISGRPLFFNDPTYPHDGIITLAHCTGPRKMDGKNLEPARIMTHFESDYGAAPKVEMRKGQIVTNVIPDFKAEHFVGLTGEIVDHPLLPICRDQIDIRFKCDSLLLAQRMPGFHWMTIYGDYLREVGYALKKIPIGWESLG